VSFRMGVGPALRSLLLPCLCLGIGHAPIVCRFLYNNVIETARNDYVRTAHAKGLSPRTVFVRYVLRNSLIPVVTAIGLTFGRLLGGVVVTESVFAWPGMGTLLVTSVGNRDYGVVQATILLLVVAFVCVNLLVDVSYGWLNPQVRLD